MKRRLVTIDTLECGLHPAISGAEYASLRGCSLSLIAKERSTGRGIPFFKDPITGRITYKSCDVLAQLQRGKLCTSTAQYDTSSQTKRLERARAVLAAKNVCSNRAQAPAT